MNTHETLIASLTPLERANLVWPMIPETQMEAAMCLWEAWMAAETGNVRAQTLYDAHRDGVGTVQLRHNLMALVPAVHIGWAVYEVGYESPANAISCLFPFDWEFVPWFLENCVEIDPRFLSLRPGWLDLCRNPATP